MLNCPHCGATSWMNYDIRTRGCYCRYCNHVFNQAVMDRIHENDGVRYHLKLGTITNTQYTHTMEMLRKQREEEDLYFELKNGRPWYEKEKANEY